MATYQTPGVYVEEISTLPPSVAEVSTAIPAFFGYTKAGKKVARIDTLLDYEITFGAANPANFTVQTSEDADTGRSEVLSVVRDTSGGQADYLLYYSLSLYFKNGGGSCYIVSVGSYGDTPVKADFEEGLAELEKEDEPTLIVLTDAVSLSAADYHDLCQQVLAQCNKLGDRFAVLDVLAGDIGDFRNSIGTNYLRYGAAYHPYLNSSLNFHYLEDGIAIEGDSGGDTAKSHSFDLDGAGHGIEVRYTGAIGDNPEVKIINGSATDAVTFEIEGQQLIIRDVNGKKGGEIATAWTGWTDSNDSGGFGIAQTGNGSGQVDHTSNVFVGLDTDVDTGSTTLASIKATNTGLYNQIKTAMTSQRVILPPSSAIAGVYASVDRERGVWKAPANVTLSAVIGPVTKITHDDQESMNIDPTAGISINAIRAFTGKGTLVWGARTLAGNDNEWRYVSVRRLFNMIEESTQKATGFAVFEPNDTTTWLKVKAMIESYLYGLWEQGALAGATPEASYFVNTGLGKTMTNQDVLEGRMIVEIGIAAVRPSEFIILRFSHKMQEA